MGWKLGSIGVGMGPISASFDKVPGDSQVARRVLTVLEDRRLLFGDRHDEDGWHCVRSALQIRDVLTEALAEAKPESGLSDSLQAMRGAVRRFVTAAGPDAQNFAGGYQNSPAFWAALGELRALMGQQIGLVAAKYRIKLEPELRSIVPVEPDQDLDGFPVSGTTILRARPRSCRSLRSVAPAQGWSLLHHVATPFGALEAVVPA